MKLKFPVVHRRIESVDFIQRNAYSKVEGGNFDIRNQWKS